MQKYTQACMILDYSDLVKCGYNKTDKKNFSDKEIFFSLVIKYLGETVQNCFKSRPIWQLFGWPLVYCDSMSRKTTVHRSQ